MVFKFVQENKWAKLSESWELVSRRKAQALAGLKTQHKTTIAWL